MRIILGHSALKPKIKILQESTRTDAELLRLIVLNNNLVSILLNLFIYYNFYITHLKILLCHSI